MSLRWADPFDHYGGDETAMDDGSYAWAQIDSTWALTNTLARTGSWSLECNTTAGGIVRRVLNDSQAVAKLGYALYTTSLPSSEGSQGTNSGWFNLFEFRDASNNTHVSIKFGTNGQVEAFRGNAVGFLQSGVSLGRSSATTLIPAAAWSHIEAKVKIHNTDGYVEVRLNGVTILNVTGVDTCNSANVECSQIAIGQGGTFDAFPAGTRVRFDDMICSDDQGSNLTDFVGDKKVFYLPPNADTSQEDFTPSSGSDSYAMLDEAPPNDSDYISLAAATGKTAMGCANLSGDTAAISAVVSFMRAKKDDAGTCDIKPGIRQGSTYASGAAQPATTTFGYYGQVFYTDPVSGVPFTPSDVNSLECVVERAA